MKLYVEKVYNVYQKGIGDEGYKLWQLLVFALIGASMIFGSSSSALGIRSQTDAISQTKAEVSGAITSGETAPQLHGEVNNAKHFNGYGAATLRWENFPPTGCRAVTDEWENYKILENCTYTVGTNNSSMWTVKLIDGWYNFISPDPLTRPADERGGPQYVTLKKHAEGDLNGDDIDDAAVILRLNYHGTGNWLNMIVLVQDSDERYDQIVNYMFEDREEVRGLYIDDGIIIAHTILHDGDDALCCPSIYETLRFKIVD